MRLRDLDARFVHEVVANVKPNAVPFVAQRRGSMRMSQSDAVAGMQGILFQCPSCGASCEQRVDHERDLGGSPRKYLVGAHSILVLFSNPRDTEPAPADAGPEASAGNHPRWTIVSGSMLGDLTLSPSINCDIPWKDEKGVEHESSCKFHGWVKNGEAA